MAKLSDGKDTRFSMLLWGPPKSGKTILASQFPHPYFVCLEKGLGSVRAMTNAQKLQVDFPVIDIDSDDSTDQDFIALCGPMKGQTCWAKTKKAFEMLCKTLPADNHLVIDNLSRMSEQLMVHVKKLVARDTFQQQDWGTYATELQTFMGYMAVAKCNVIFVGHEEWREDKVSGEVLKTILMPGSMKHRIPGIVSDYVYLSSIVSGPAAAPKVVRKLQCTPNKYVNLGNRSLMPNMEDPTYEKMRPYLSAALGHDLGEPTWTPLESTTSK